MDDRFIDLKLAGAYGFPVPSPAQQPSANKTMDTPESTNTNAYLWEMLCHLTALSGLIGVPFGNVIGPLVIWLIKKDEVPAVDDHGKESLNFQLSITIYMMVAGILIFVFIGIFLLIGLMIVDVVFVVIASIKASNGIPYKYPMTIRFIK